MRRTASLVVAALTALTALAATPDDAAGAATRPNLKVSRIHAPAQVTVGHRATFRVSVHNAAGRAGASKVRLYLSNDGRHDRGDVALGTVGAKGMGAGATVTVKATFKMPAELGPHHVVACADATHQVTESSETDNCTLTKATVWVWPKPQAYVAGTPDPRDVTPQLGTPTVTKAIGPAGGRVTLRAGSKNYHLVVPAKALVSTVAITMRPITQVDGLGMSDLLAGVDIAPHGLALLRPAQLTLVPTTSVPLSRQAGFVYGDDGTDLHAYGLEPDGTLEMELTHLGGVGVGDATPAQRAAQQARVPADPEAQWEQQLAAFKDDLRQVGATSRARTAAETQQGDEHAILAQAGARAAAYVRDVAVPGLRTALAGDTTRTGPAAIRAFLGAARQLELLGVGDEQSPTVADGWQLVTQIIDKMIPDAYHRCVTEHDPGMALLMLSVERQRQLLGIGDQALTFATMNKCLHFEVDYEFELDGSAWSDDDSSNTAYGYHLRALHVPVSIDIQDPETSGTGSGPEEYLQYSGVSTTRSSYFHDGHEVDCTGTGTAAGTEDGTFHVRGMKLDLNYYSDDPEYRKPFRLDLQIDPGAVGAPDAPQDITDYTADDPSCIVPQGTVHNWFAALAFLFAHLDESTDEDGTSYSIENWSPGSPGSEELATKVYDRDVVGNGAPHELTTLTLRHTPQG